MTSKPQSNEASSENQNAADEKAKKEELVEAKMRLIRKKNEELIRRKKEVEEDRKNADLYSEMAVKKHPENFPSGVTKDATTSGRGRGRGLMLQELRKETMKAKQWEAKRRENVRKEEEEQRKRGSNTPSAASRFLVDDNRVDMSKTRGRNENSWGGGSFNKVVNRVQREKEGFQSGRFKGNNFIEMTMSGKERHEYNQWREERARIDRERKERQKKSGNWSRDWDQAKVWDPRRKMWVYESDTDNHSFKNTIRQDSDNSEDWGSDNRYRRRDNQGQRSGKQGGRHSGGFQQHDDRGMQAGKEWGETMESKDSQHQEEWGESNNVHQKEEWGKSDESRVSQHDKEWGKNSEKEDNKSEEEQNKATENSRTVENNAPQHEAEWGQTGRRVLPEKAESNNPDLSDNQQHQAAVSGPCPSTENSKESTGTTEVTSESTPQDIPKPQRELKQRLMQSDSAENDSVELVSPVNEIQPPLDKEDSPEFVKTPVTDTSEEGTLSESGHAINERENTASMPVHCIDREKTTEGEATPPHGSITQKAANLPRLNTKSEKKVTFDSKEKEQVKDNDSQSASPEAIGDIPPTPDFLKFDNTLPWGEIEIDDEDCVVTEPKW